MTTKALRTIAGKLFLLITLIAIAGLGSFSASASANPYPLINDGNPLGGDADQASSSPMINAAERHTWTREEMLSAIPVPMEMVGQPSTEGDPAPSASGPEVKVEATPPKVGKGSKKGTNPLQGSGDVSVTYASGILDPYYYTHFPHSTIGKVFFTNNGENYVCSASVMGNNALWTAGHCVFSEKTRTWHTNWAFVPAYYDGNAPYGQWHARELWALRGWTDSLNLAYDLGSAVLWPNATSVAYYTGSLGWWANGPRGVYITAFGYPAQYGFTGQRMAWCQDYTWTDTRYSPATNAMGCNMTGGSSGGPWIYQYTYNSAGSNNYVNGVNSYVDNRYAPTVMHSPYFGDGAINLYNTVINR